MVESSGRGGGRVLRIPFGGGIFLYQDVELLESDNLDAVAWERSIKPESRLEPVYQHA